MEAYIRERQFTFHSKRLLEELRVFIWMHGKAQAQNGYNDDLVMALGMGLFVRDTAMKFYEQGMNMTRQNIDNITRTGLDMAPGSFMSNNPYQMDIGNGQIEDISWILG
jgi:hypothetical protein